MNRLDSDNDENSGYQNVDSFSMEASMSFAVKPLREQNIQKPTIPQKKDELKEVVKKSVTIPKYVDKLHSLLEEIKDDDILKLGFRLKEMLTSPFNLVDIKSEVNPIIYDQINLALNAMILDDSVATFSLFKVLKEVAQTQKTAYKNDPKLIRKLEVMTAFQNWVVGFRNLIKKHEKKIVEEYNKVRKDPEEIARLRSEQRQAVEIYKSMLTVFNNIQNPNTADMSI